MNESQLVLILGSIVAQSAPLMLAVTGETLTERVGVINLSLDGTMLLTAMSGFVTALLARTALESAGISGDFLPVMVGLAVSAIIGMAAALLVAWGSVRLKQDQVAIGFVLTLLLADLANFLGQNYTRKPGPSVAHFDIPVLGDLPVIGPVFFQHDLLIYAVFLIVGVTWWWLYRTQPGLQLRGVGENPDSAFGRGVAVTKLRYLYTGIGGAMVGVAGAAYSLDIKLGWSDNHILGIGWIALAITIFGGWHPLRGVIGAFLYGATKAAATYLQQAFPEIPVVLFNTFQWLLMLGVLLLVGSEGIKRIVDIAPPVIQRPLAAALRIAPPRSLGRVIGDE